MKLEFEYGHGTMSADLPDTTDIFIRAKRFLIQSVCHRIGIVCTKLRSIVSEILLECQL